MQFRGHIDWHQRDVEFVYLGEYASLCHDYLIIYIFASMLLTSLIISAKTSAGAARHHYHHLSAAAVAANSITRGNTKVNIAVKFFYVFALKNIVRLTDWVILNFTFTPLSLHLLPQIANCPLSP